ncbi:flagellar hook-associated protein FlgK [Bdellovibrionota bacterium FG-2]
MGVSGVLTTGRSGMAAAKTAIATAGHNIANANTEGYSRQKVGVANASPQGSILAKGAVGSGVEVTGIDRVNDEYLERQLRNGARDMAGMEEKDMGLRQLEDIFNEVNGEGLNRVISRFFNDFRKLANEPENEAVRESVREASLALVNDFHRIRGEVMDVRNHLDSRVEAYAGEASALAEDLKRLNHSINQRDLSKTPANDLRDQRDQLMKKLGSLMDVALHKDHRGDFFVDIKGVGPLVTGTESEKLMVVRSPADDQGKGEGAYSLQTTARAGGDITHQVKGGKIGALLEVRDKTLTTVLSKLDDLAFNLSQSVNEIHQQGFTRNGLQGVDFFTSPVSKDRAAEFFDLSEAVKSNVDHIATAAQPDAPGDNRIALAISGLQHLKVMHEGKSTLDDWFNSIVSDVGVISARNRSGLNQQRDINTQLGKMRERVSGVSVDEETANLMQFQHSFDASAKVIQVADEMLKTVLDLKR